MANTVPVDDLPSNLVPADDLPAPSSEVVSGSPLVPPHDLPSNLVPADDLPSAPPQAVSPQGQGPSAAGEYLKSHPATNFSIEASPIGPAKLAKAGTIGIAEDISDKQREANSLKDAALGFFNARIQQYFLDPDFLHLSPDEQNQIIDSQVSAWEQAGLPAGKLNEANPAAWLGVGGKNTLREAMNNYVNDIRIKGLAGAQAPGGVFDGNALAVQQIPSALQTAGLEFTRGIPGLFGSNIGGEAGAAAGAASGIPGAAIALGVGGSLLGAFGGEELTRGAIDKYADEDTRNALEKLDMLTNIGEEEHPLAAWLGQMGGQFTHNQLGFQQLLRGKGFSEAIAPRLAGGFIGGGVEAASEKGRGEDLDPYKIGQAALSGTVFTKPRYLGEGAVPMSFEGRNWTDTNVPLPQHVNAVEELLRSGKAPKTIFETLGDTLPNTPENVSALRTARAELAAGRDPTTSIDQLKFRPNGLSVDKTVSTINEHIKDWTNAPAIQVHDSYDSPSIPENMQDKVGPGTLGWKDENGEIHIVASQHVSPDAVTATMFHEGMHVGLVRAYQQGLEDKLVNVYDHAGARFKSALNKMEAEQAKTRSDWGDLNEDQRKALVVDEVLANTSEHGVHSNEFDKVSSWIRSFGRTKLGEMGRHIKYSDGEIRQILSTGHDAVSKGEGAAVGPTRYMNFGVRSDTADTESLGMYNGKLPDQPEYEQGWFKGPADNQPRYEVSDKDANLDLSELHRRGSARLVDILDHPELYKAYPDLKGMKVKLTDDETVNGSYNPKYNTISLSPRAENPMGTLLHEVQHAIQQHEGWAKGANPEAVFRSAPIEQIHQVLDEQIETAQSRADHAAEYYHALETAKNDPTIQNLRKLYQSFRDNSGQHGGEYARAYRSAEKKLREDLGVEDPWDPQYNDLLYQTVKSEHPIEWHQERAREDWQRNIDNVKRYTEAQSDEWKARAAVRWNDEMSEKLYNRAGGEYEARATTARRGMDDIERLDNPQFTQVDSRGAGPDNIYAPNDVIDSESKADVRFSRKYSDNFSKDYQGRQDRTEDLLKNHFGNFSINNVKGMMRPLEQYNRLTDEDIKNAAQDLKDQGFDAGIAVAQGAIPDNSGFVVALRDLVRDKLETASEVAGRYRKSGGMRHERELMSAVTDLGQVLAVFDKTASNLGRMLHSLRLRLDTAKTEDAVSAMLNNIRFANGTLDAEQLDNIAKTLLSKDPLEIRKAIDKFDPTWKQYAQSLFYNHILGSKAVQLGNIMGNATHIVQKGVGDILGYGVGLGQEAAFRAGDKAGLDVSAPNRMHSDELGARLAGLWGGMLNERTYGGKAWNNMAKEFFVPAGQSEHVNKFASQSIENLPLSLALEYGTRGLQATDAFFRTIVEHSAMQGLATREARRLNDGKKPSIDQIADVMANPTREMLKQVTDEADRITFQEQPFPIAEKFSRWVRGVPGGWLVSPIIRTPSNIGRTAFETFDPTGRITKRNREALKAGGPEANRVRGNQLLAGALWAGALYLMQENMLNGGGPTKPEARAQWLESHVPYSIGNDKTGFTPLRGISPVGDGLSMIADMRDAGKFISKDPELSAQDKAFMIAAGMSDAYLSNSFMSSMTQQLERGMKPAIQNILGTVVQAASSVPLYSQAKKEADPFVRDTSSEGNIVDSMADKASLMDNPMMAHYFKGIKPRDELPIRRDVFGAPIMADSPTSKDPVAIEVGRLVDSTGKAVVPSFSRTVKGMHVPNDVYNSFLAIAGPVQREAVSQIMNDPVYHKALTDDQRAAIIRSNKTLKGLHERLGKQLQQMMLDRNPKFEGNYISDDLKTLSTIPGEN